MHKCVFLQVLAIEGKKELIILAMEGKEKNCQVETERLFPSIVLSDVSGFVNALFNNTICMAMRADPRLIVAAMAIMLVCVCREMIR